MFLDELDLTCPPACTKVPVVTAPHPGRSSGGGPSGSGAPGQAFYGYNAGQAWSPAVNLYETDRLYVACVDLAGVDKDKIEVELDGHLLHLRGSRSVPNEFDPGCFGDITSSKRCRVHLMEIDHGAFSRTVELPSDADRDAISARYREGLLWIEVPKRPDTPR